MGALAQKPVKKKSPPKRLMKQIRKLIELGRYKASIPFCEKLIKSGYDAPELFYLTGRAQRGLGNLDAALIATHAAMESDPYNMDYLLGVATIFFDMGELETAIELFKKATKLDEKSYEAWKRLGIALRVAERYQAAELAFTYARHLDPSQIEPILNMVVMLNEVKNYDMAETLLDDLLKDPKNRTPEILLKRYHVAASKQDLDYLEKNYADIDRDALCVDEQAKLDNLWAFYLDLNLRHDEAIEILEGWAFKETSHRDLITSFLGILYATTGRLQDGIAMQRKILEENPDDVAARYNIADLLLRNGELKESFEKFEARWQWPGFPSKKRVFDMPRWEGESLEGKTLLVWREQGIGDELTHASVLPELEYSGGNIILECAPKLKPVWEKSFPWITIREEGPVDARQEPGYENIDYQVPLGSVRKFFRDSVESFVERQKPWLVRDPENEERIRQQIGVEENELLVGVCLRSGKLNAARNPSFVTTEQFKALHSLKNVKWLDVQYDNSYEEIERLRDFGFDLHHYTNLDQKEDLIGASRLIGACDILISVGVSVADIACGMGVPTVHIAREHSAIYMGTDFIPWFPTSRAYQMPPNGGAGAVERILQDWPEIIEWAAEITTADRTFHVKAIQNQSSDQKRLDRKALDLTYNL